MQEPINLSAAMAQATTYASQAHKIHARDLKYTGIIFQILQKEKPVCLAVMLSTIDESLMKKIYETTHFQEIDSLPGIYSQPALAWRDLTDLFFQTSNKRDFRSKSFVCRAIELEDALERGEKNMLIYWERIKKIAPVKDAKEQQHEIHAFQAWRKSDQGKLFIEKFKEYVALTSALKDLEMKLEEDYPDFLKTLENS